MVNLSFVTLRLNFDISKMGEAALARHAKEEKHVDNRMVAVEMSRIVFQHKFCTTQRIYAVT